MHSDGCTCVLNVQKKIHENQSSRFRGVQSQRNETYLYINHNIKILHERKFKITYNKVYALYSSFNIFLKGVDFRKQIPMKKEI